jgi:proteic killer suppression protein
VKITFENRKLEKLANDDKKMVKEFGATRAKIIRRRLTQLASACTLEDVRYMSGNYHELTQNRKGQWACDLDQPYRLLFEPLEKPIPQNEDGQYIWIEIKGVEIIEIVDYH